MDTDSSSSDTLPRHGSTASSTAHISAYLIVHAESNDQGGRRGRHGPTPLQRLRALYWSGSTLSDEAALSLTLADGHGRTVLSLADADPVLGIALVPGTYHLTATRGDTRRGYTVALPAGSRFDLHLRFTTPERLTQAAPIAPWSARSVS
jgi:hypothetical protein